MEIEPMIIRIGEIVPGLSILFNKHINTAKRNSQNIVPVVIDSFGGNVKETFKIIDTMNNCGLKIYTISVGKAESAAALILCSGFKRYASQNSTIMFHNIGFEVKGGDKSDAGIACAEEAIKLMRPHYNDIINNILKSKNVNQLVIDRMVIENKDKMLLTPPQAKEYGVIDEVGIPEIDISMNFKFSI